MFGKRDGNLGILKLNREHRYNTLTPNFVQNVHRGIESLNRDTDISTIFMSTHKGQ